jgi:SAC3 family protein LENG8/THP3
LFRILIAFQGDLGEYNQCQTQLFSLYKTVKGGYADEFRGYYLLYLLHTCNNSDINDYLANLTPAEKKTKGVAHALLVRAALAQGNYHKLFKLYMDCPGMGAYLMDLFIPRERIAALAVMCKA